MWFLSMLFGIVVGIATGLIPALHINQVANLLSSFKMPEHMLAFFLSLAITHSFLDFIPTILLGIPNEFTLLSTLPGYYFVQRGKAFYAVKLTLYGSLFAILFSVFLFPIYALLINFSFDFLKLLAKPFLIFVISLLFFSERYKKYAFFAILASFTLGFISLKMLNLSNPFSPLIIGFFPLSQCIIGFISNEKFPKQKLTEDYFPENAIFYAFLGFIAGMLSSIFAILSPAQMAFVISFFFGSTPSTFLITLGAINTAYLFLSFISAYAGFKPHSLIAIKAYEKFSFSLQELPLIFSTGILTAFSAFAIGYFLAKFIIRKVSALEYSTFSLLMLLFLITFVFLTSSFEGILLALSAAAVGLICTLSGVKKSHCMCFLLATFV